MYICKHIGPYSNMAKLLRIRRRPIANVYSNALYLVSESDFNYLTNDIREIYLIWGKLVMESRLCYCLGSGHVLSKACRSVCMVEVVILDPPAALTTNHMVF
jgi:hypothetical protein